MRLNILCFEDNPRHQVLLQEIFAQYDAKFLFLSDPPAEWNVVSPAVLNRIVTFKPTLAIVDLRNDAADDINAGYRIIRQLKETDETRCVPVIAWSVLICDSPDGQRAIKRVENLGAVPLQKSTDIPTPPSRFLEAAGL